MQQKKTIYAFVQELESTMGAPLQIDQHVGYYTVLPADEDYALILYCQEIPHKITSSISRTFHIDIDQIRHSSTKLLYRLSALLGKGPVIYARQSVVSRIDKKVALDFQQEHHLQAALPGKYRYGLFYNGELVSAAVFSGGRRMHEIPDGQRSFELLRFCHKMDLRVVGGLSKLIHAFVKDFQPYNIMTYVDKDWAQESNLTTIGFLPVSTIPPQRFWVVGEQRYYIHDDENLYHRQKEYPGGYLKYNSGSTKLVLTL